MHLRKVLMLMIDGRIGAAKNGCDREHYQRAG